MIGAARRFRWLLLVLSGLIALPLAQAAKHERKRAERAEVVQLEERWRQAQLSNDIPAMDRLLADEFLGITAGGQVVTKAQQLDRMRTRRLDIKKFDVSDTKIKISGNLAVVTSLASIEGVADGKPLNGLFRYTRVYHRAGRGDWKITNFEATHVHPRRGEASSPEAGFPGSPAAGSSSAATSPEESGSHPPLS